MRIKPHKSTRLLIFSLLLAAAVLASTARATMVGWQSLESLTARSDRIVHAEVTYTDIELRVLTSIKSPDNARTFRFRQLGGSVNDTTLTVPGMPRFHEGEEVFLFLSRAQGDVSLVTGLSQGKFTVITDPTTGRKTLFRDVQELMFVGAQRTGTDPTSMRSLDEMLTNVRRIDEQ
jgi:hypothetical protein